MRFTSLVVELIRARPRLVVWIVVLAQAGLWLILPMLLYPSPPGDVATVLAFSSPGVEFGPLVLARPLWALLLLHSWQLIGQNRRNAWFAWSIEAGLLLLTTSAAPGLLLLLAGFAVAAPRGRRVLMSLDPLYALLVIAVLVLPYLIWLLRADALAMPSWPAISDLGARAMQWGWLLG